MSKTDQNIADNKELLLLALEECGAIVTAACRNAGVSRDTYYRYLSEDPAFAAAVKDIEEQCIDHVEHGLYILAKGGAQSEKVQVDAAKTYLNAKARSRGYGTEVRKQEISGELGVNGRVVLVKLPRNGREPADD